MNAQLRKQAIAYVRAQQQSNGSFKAGAGPELRSFVATKQQSTIFPTILITDSLHAIPGTKNIRKQAAHFIASQRHAQGSWNYWQTSTTAYSQEPYPDDLDDTACALAMLSRHHGGLSGAEQAQLAKLLVASEHQPGGPYNTWLINTRQAKQWQDVDIAVNANIAYMLSLQGVTLTKLTAWIDAHIAAHDITSQYYVGTAPVLYFLSRAYAGKERVTLRKLIVRTLQETTLTALEIALLLSAGCRLRVAPIILADAAARLEVAAVGGHWQAHPFYVDPMYDGIQYYSGSEALTTAFALEALHSYDELMIDAKQTRSEAPEDAVHATLHAAVQHDLQSVVPEIQTQYTELVTTLLRASEGKQVLAPISLLTSKNTVLQATTTKLLLGSMHGWLAYSLYDTIADEHTGYDTLPIAHMALRRSYANFHAALPHNRDFAVLIDTTFDTMDAANRWEQLQARAVVTESHIVAIDMPSYGNHRQLAERSYGHRLAFFGVLLAQYKSMQHPALQAFDTFFTHFIIARQLHDDAHDWEADLRSGQLSAVVCRLLAKHGTKEVMVSTDMPLLRKLFWQHIIVDVSNDIVRHVARAQAALDECEPYMNVTAARGWLNGLRDGVRQALQGKAETEAFIASFEGAAHK